MIRWMVGPNWPNSGEVDIIEGVNSQTADQTTLHTSNGCSIYSFGLSSFSSLLLSPTFCPLFFWFLFDTFLSQSSSTNMFTGHWGDGTNGQPATNCYIDAPNQASNQVILLFLPLSSPSPPCHPLSSSSPFLSPLSLLSLFTFENQGCGIIGAEGSYGEPFNNANGGVYVTEWTGSCIKKRDRGERGEREWRGRDRRERREREREEERGD